MKTLAKYVQAARIADKGIFGVGSQQLVLERPLWVSVVQVLSEIKRAPFNSEKGLLDKCNFADADKAVALMLSSNAVCELDDFDSTNRYSRNHLFYNYMQAKPAYVQEKLKSSKVVVIGCGGIGTNIAYFLAGSGVGNIILADKDFIELSNLTRQIVFTEQDVGKSKIEILKRELLKRNASINVTTTELDILSTDSFSVLPSADLYVISADSPFRLMHWANEYCVKNRQAYINIGYINDISVIGPFYIAGETACYACHPVAPDYELLDELDLLCKEINSDFKTASFPGVNGVAASYAFNDIVKFLGGFGDILSKNKRIGIHSSKCEFEFQIIEKNPRCRICAAM